MKNSLFILAIFCTILVNAQKATGNYKECMPGAYQTEHYFSLLKDKRVAVFANHTSVINATHLIDTLVKVGIKIVKIFAPEHGFRGTADAGEKLNNAIDSATQIPIISLYGKKLKPSNAELADVDVMLFDIQDVGVRYYTYISSLQYYIESAIDADKPLIILDRPNPNGFYVDGPVLDDNFKSFVGMQPIPIVYGMTIGEYATMLVGEKWLDWKYIRKADNKISLTEILGFENERKNFKLNIIPCKNYTHSSRYILPVKPSPNLPTMASVYCYPSICLFEGTIISEGRGTDYPFCVFGHPNFSKDLYAFTPISKSGAKEPKFKNKICYGWNLFNSNNAIVLNQLNKQLQIGYLINAYKICNEKENFFLKPTMERTEEYFFNKLAGTALLMQQIKQGNTEAEIRVSWQAKLLAFKQIRKKYLLYKDFE